MTEGLERLGVHYEIDDRKVRGFDYYTRTVFEFILTDPEFQAGEMAMVDFCPNPECPTNRED